MSYRQSDFWTAERTERFVALWTEGRLSANQIAGVFSSSERRSVSRNAILGKARRMKLARRRVAKARSTSTPRKRIERPVAAKPAPAAMPVPAPIVADVARLQLEELTDVTCKWPVGDPKLPGFGFCGLPAADGHVYCAGHRHRSIRPPKPVSIERRVHAVA